MGYLEAIVLGIVQGLTEFIPVSSTAHLRIVPALFGRSDPGEAFSAVIQIGTLAAVFLYFRREIGDIARGWLRDLIAFSPRRSFESRLGWMIIFGTVPIVVCGVLFKEAIRTTLRNLYLIAGWLIILAVALAVAEAIARARRLRGDPGRDLPDVKWLDAAWVGLAQALALAPGVSRSGVTIFGGLLCGLTRETAARFSFLMSLPAVLAAGLFELYAERQALLASGDDVAKLLASMLASAIVGYASIAFLLGYLRRHSTWLFIVYRIALGGLLLALVWSGKLAPN